MSHGIHTYHLVSNPPMKGTSQSLNPLKRDQTSPTNVTIRNNQGSPSQKKTGSGYPSDVN